VSGELVVGVGDGDGEVDGDDVVGDGDGEGLGVPLDDGPVLQLVELLGDEFGPWLDCVPLPLGLPELPDDGPPPPERLSA
jgi:hypothetical protein